jgi:hypothetical protein
VNPTFNSVALTDNAPTESLAGPVSRTARETMPDVQGEFFQVAPPGGRQIVVRGVLASAVQVTAELAAADLKENVRARQGLVGAVATYQGVDGEPYADSLMLSFDQAGPMEISTQGAGLQALMRVEAQVLTQP